MSELTEQQLIDLRADLGDTGATPAFTDAELQALWDRAEESHTKTVLWGFDQLIASATKFTDYTQNETQEKKSQIFDHLLKLRSLWKDRLAQDVIDARAVSPSSLTRLRPIWNRKSSPYA